jgi:phage gp36-like protein
MGRYINWEDVIDRYQELNTLGGADQLSSAYIVYSEAYVDGILSTHFTPPFSSNNMIVRDLCIDWAYWRAARFKLEDAVSVKSSFFETVGFLKDGQVQMYDEAGTLIPSVEKSLAWSNTQSYHSAFGMDAIEHWKIDENQADDDEEERS